MGGTKPAAAAGLRLGAVEAEAEAEADRFCAGRFVRGGASSPLLS